MDKNELPLGFSFSLAQNQAAMKNFAELSDPARSEILQKARSVSSKSEMQALVNNLAGN